MKAASGGGGLEREQKQGWSDLKEESHEEEKKEHDIEEDVLNCSDYFRGSSQFDTVTASNDNIFYEAEELDGGAHKTVHFDVADTSQEETSQRPSGRTRADSYIVRADTRNRQRSESILLLDQSEPGCDRDELPISATPVVTPSRGLPAKSDTLNHQQLRRISRSMSISMQLSKTNNEDDQTALPNTDGILKQLTRHAVMIVYHVLSRSDETTWWRVLSLHYIPILVNTLSLFEEQFKGKIGLPISASLINCQKFLQDSTQGIYP